MQSKSNCRKIDDCQDEAWVHLGSSFVCEAPILSVLHLEVSVGETLNAFGHIGRFLSNEGCFGTVRRVVQGSAHCKRGRQRAGLTPPHGGEPKLFNKRQM